ncbi:V-type H+-transporting ATPase subunit F [Enteropsectra breve]|nr:V-type H+-transporting ATPase subunit F [Enteropsectra breve]
MDFSKIAVIGDEETVVGYELAGVVRSGEGTNIHIVKRNESSERLAEIFDSLVERKDIAIIFICEFASQIIEKKVQGYKKILPSLLVVPSKYKH